MNTLITGTSRGIGFGLVNEALKAGHKVYAVARNTSSLQKLAIQYPDQLMLLQMDISQPGAIEALARRMQDVNLDVLINNAGMMTLGETAEDLAQSFWVNATVPFLLSQALLPSLKKSALPRVAQISTLMASIQDNTSGGYYAYRSSKTALNMLTRSLAIDHPSVIYALIHPGWVKTDMGGARAPTEVAESVAGIWKVIMSMRAENSGQYVNFKGEVLPW
jgi:NAD(P)-dependent dehydrogenase (short-subunit alcohol dehydrogenase family)